ncbi:hypothetical protein UMM65_01345 [Aureibaculum sp. 2210JD6-5]|uniref:hypothetical protein n=1 Tax=Aureibaculum sp. 2210JD6-5 TaxID=3103957 RepID=UPI002AACBA85|nr:hypothetical protein [Aureibaculum sp. 2210JD6-5]MDY7393876.1 hypothetical protein [Aureibaculum sp. 2210JD6-5]
MNRVVDLKYQMSLSTKLIEAVQMELFQIENSEKLIFVKGHLREWFEEKNSLIMPLEVNDNSVKIIRIGQYEKNPFIEFEDVVIQNLEMKKSLGKTLPKIGVKHLKKILKIVKIET